MHGLGIPVHLSAGAVIDRDVLTKEAEEFPELPIFVHPNAAIVTDEDRRAEETGSIAEVAGTRSGTGEALVRKIRREPKAIAKYSLGCLAPNITLEDRWVFPERYCYFMEVSQGFSLGINSEFYPKVTSRECTVMQGLADARIAPRHLARTYMAIRTYPIRVGNVDGFSSGEWYPDQHEVNWEDLNVPPELTTVTKRVRRVATFSEYQFRDALNANDPDYVFISHLDYLRPENKSRFLEMLHVNKPGRKWEGTILGSGPHVKDVKLMEERHAHQHFGPNP